MTKNKIPDSILEEWSDRNILYKTEYQRSTDTSLCTAIVEAVATVSGTDITEIEPIYEVVDPDAVNSIFRPWAKSQQPSDGYLRITVHGFPVHIFNSGMIIITDPATGDTIPEEPNC